MDGTTARDYDERASTEITLVAPKLSFAKSPELDDPGATIDVGGSSTFYLVATNTGFTTARDSRMQSGLDGKVTFKVNASGSWANLVTCDVERIDEVKKACEVLAKGSRIKDSTDESRTEIKLPSETNGMVMVFRTFERVSYALILDVRIPVRVGDRLIHPD